MNYASAFTLLYQQKVSYWSMGAMRCIASWSRYIVFQWMNKTQQNREKLHKFQHSNKLVSGYPDDDTLFKGSVAPIYATNNLASQRIRYLYI